MSGERSGACGIAKAQGEDCGTSTWDCGVFICVLGCFCTYAPSCLSLKARFFIIFGGLSKPLLDVT